MPSLLIATSRYTYKHPLYSRNRAMIEFLQRNRGLHFSKVTVLYPDHHVRGSSPSLKMLDGGLEELRFSLLPLRGEHPGIEPTYAASRIIPYFRRWKLHYDYCVAADLTGWQIAYPLRRFGYVSSLIYDDQDYFPWVLKNPQGRLITVGLEKIIAKYSDLIVSASETLAKLRRRQGARHVIVIPNGADPTFYLSGEIPYAERLRRKTILYAGYLDHEYGLDLLVEALSRLRLKLDVKLVIAGIGPLEDHLRRISKTPQFNSSLQLLGKVEHDRLVEVMSVSTLGAAPFLESSGAGYGVPLKIKEYLAAGLPVVATRIGEISRFIQDRGLGIAVEPTVEALTEGLSSILRLAPADYASMGEHARAVGIDYSWDNLFPQYFQALLERSS